MMIDKLRKKLIISTIAALLVIFVVMIWAMNAISFYSTQRQVSHSLEVLAGSQTESGSTQRIRDNLPDVTASTLYRVSNYCIIRLIRTGEIYEWKSENGDLYNDAVVENLLQEIKDSGETQGKIGSHMFRVEKADRGDKIVVIDIRSEQESARNLLRITIIVGTLFWAILSCLSAVLICRVLRPVSEAFQKQQQFVWDASHELKTPLAVISANAQVLALEIGENESLQYILDEVGRTNTLVQNLLSLARMDADRTKGEIREFDLGKTLLQTILPMESLIFEQGKVLNLQISEGIFYTGNEGLLQELAVILLSNAMKYSEPGSEITVSLRAKGSHRVLRVHNTGSYIDPETRQHIFERFYRGDSSRNRDAGGTGLGLAIAWSIVEHHRGNIRVESDPQSGTAFIVTLTDITN